MRSIERRFRSLQEDHPAWSTITCFDVAVWHQKFSEQTIRRWFYKLVDRDDYYKGMVKEIIAYALLISMHAEDDKKSTSFALQWNEGSINDSQ